MTDRGEQMAVRFQSAIFRNMWLAAIVDYAVDATLTFLIVTALDGDSALVWALLFPIAIYVFRAALALYQTIKRAAFFFLFDRKRRVRVTLAEMKQLHMPSPRSFYADIDEYLRAVVLSASVSDEARLSAAITLGTLVSQRAVGPRTEALLTAIVLEEALAQIQPADEADEEELVRETS